MNSPRASSPPPDQIIGLNRSYSPADTPVLKPGSPIEGLQRSQSPLEKFYESEFLKKTENTLPIGRQNNKPKARA